MYLIHIRLLPHGHDDLLPDDTSSAVGSCAVAEMGVQHVTVHPHARPHPVIGIYLHARSLEEAEATALMLWGRTMSRDVRFWGWQLVRVEAALVRFNL